MLLARYTPNQNSVNAVEDAARSKRWILQPRRDAKTYQHMREVTVDEALDENTSVEVELMPPRHS
jgi:hypothetical protein